MEAAEPDVTVTSKELEELLDQLSASGVERAWLLGGGSLAGSFRDRRLINEYIISIIPVILGEGIPMFSASAEREYLELTSARPFANGVVQLRYLRR
jgi:dihydrofolate reductase